MSTEETKALRQEAKNRTLDKAGVIQATPASKTALMPSCSKKGKSASEHVAERQKEDIESIDIQLEAHFIKRLAAYIAERNEAKKRKAIEAAKKNKK